MWIISNVCTYSMANKICFSSSKRLFIQRSIKIIHLVPFFARMQPNEKTMQMNLLQIVDMSQVRGSNYGSKKMALFISAITTYLYNYIWYMNLHTYKYVCVLQSTIQKKTNEASQLTYMYILWLDSSLFCSRAEKNIITSIKCILTIPTYMIVTKSTTCVVYNDVLYKYLNSEYLIFMKPLIFAQNQLYFQKIFILPIWSYSIIRCW